MNKQDIQTVLDALKTSAHYLIGYSEHREAAITICEAALAEPSESKPYCCYCESGNDGIRSTYFDQTCEGCVERMTHPASKPAPLPELSDDDLWTIWDDFYGHVPSYDRPVYEPTLYRAIEQAVWEKVK